jgi:D-alanine-D-alanine ligase
VLFDRVLVDEDESAPAGEKAPVVRTLDKKEVEEEVSEALAKLGHEPVMHELDGTMKSLVALTRMECDLVFNLTESFGDDDTADFKIAGFLELIGKKYTGSGTHGLMLAQDKAIAKKIFAFHGIHTPTFAKCFRGRLDFSHDLSFPVIVKPAREDGSIGIEFSAVVNSIRELMERMDWLHANFDSPVLIEEYIDGREMYVALEIRDYGRVDMRLQADGRVHVIEVNPNPWLSSRAELAMAARRSGRTYIQLVEEIVGLATARD